MGMDMNDIDMNDPNTASALNSYLKDVVYDTYFKEEEVDEVVEDDEEEDNDEDAISPNIRHEPSTTTTDENDPYSGIFDNIKVVENDDDDYEGIDPATAI